MRITPTVTERATALTMGVENEMNPTTVRRTPRAVNQPQPRTPRYLRSKELTNFDIPVKMSHIPKMNGSVMAVNALFPSTKRERTTVRIPSRSIQPEPSINLCPAAKMTISITPETSIATPRNTVIQVSTAPGLSIQAAPAITSKTPTAIHKIRESVLFINF